MKQLAIETLIVIMACILWATTLYFVLPGDDYKLTRGLLGFVGGLVVAHLVSTKKG